MRSDELQKILQSDDYLTLDEIKNIIYKLKNDCVMFKEDRYEAGFYNGEMNAFYICLDLLDKTYPPVAELAAKHPKITESVLKNTENILKSFAGGVCCCECERDEIICKEEGKCIKEMENA